MNIIDNTFIDTSTTTIEDMKRFIINCAKSGKRNIRIHNQYSPNLIFGKQGNFLITMNNDGNNVSCLAIDHWSTTPILFSFSISTGLDDWHFVDINHNYGIYDIPLLRNCNLGDVVIHKRCRCFNAVGSVNELPSFATNGDNDSIVINHWYADNVESFAIQIAYNIRDNNIEYRRFFGEDGWNSWIPIV